MDAACVAWRAMPARTAKLCGPDAPTLASSLVMAMSALRVRHAGIHKATVANKPGHRGERRAAVNTIAQGMSMFRLTWSDYACVLAFIAHKAAGAAKHPAFPAPSAVLRAADAKLGRISVAGMRGRVSPSLRGANGSARTRGPMTGSATKQSRASRGALDCFASLAMTTNAGQNRRVGKAQACPPFTGKVGTARKSVSAKEATAEMRAPLPTLRLPSRGGG
jgi:hypothetical protein